MSRGRYAESAPTPGGSTRPQASNSAFLTQFCKFRTEKNILDSSVFVVIVLEFKDGKLKHHRFCEWFDTHDNAIVMYAYAMLMEPNLQNIDFGLYWLNKNQSPGDYLGAKHDKVVSELKYIDPRQPISRQIGDSTRITLRVSAQKYTRLPNGSELLNYMKDSYK